MILPHRVPRDMDVDDRPVVTHRKVMYDDGKEAAEQSTEWKRDYIVQNDAGLKPWVSAKDLLKVACVCARARMCARAHACALACVWSIQVHGWNTPVRLWLTCWRLRLQHRAPA